MGFLKLLFEGQYLCANMGRVFVSLFVVHVCQKTNRTHELCKELVYL